jgi:MFS family permease
MNYADNVEKSTTPSEFPSDAQLSNEDFIQVDWEDNDPDNPRNFTAFYKSWITLQMGMLALCGTLASSIIAPSGPTLSTYLDVSQEITVLTVSLYVLGFAFGPCLWAPLSEAYGRRWSILPAIFCLGILSIGTAVSKTLAGILITRFFGGIFGSAPISNVVAALGDLYAPKPRGIAVIFFAVCVVGGPTIGPVIGAALTINLGWRWTEYTMAIWTFTVWIVSTFCMPELYHPVLLERKARLLRKKTGSSRYRYLQKKITIKDVLSKHLGRPLVMFFTEPMVTAIALYASFVYGILYMTLEVFPIVFREQRGYSPVVSTLPFLGLFVGVCTAQTPSQSINSQLIAINRCN